MKRMFASATLKLTVSYLSILIVICLVFSFIIFELSTAEISKRLERLQIRVEGSSQVVTLPGPVTLNEVRLNQTAEARTNIFFGLLYMNLAVIGLGGVGSYLLAKRTLRPIALAHEAQSRFTADASHELRTPLAIMKSEIQVTLRDKKISNKEYKDVLESTLEEVDKLTNLSESLLALSRFDDSAINLKEAVPVADSVTRAIKTLGIPAERLSLTLNSKTSIQGNVAMIVDIWRILLDNAVKYSPEASLISVEAVSNGRMCTVTVQNAGKGIANADIKHIFDRFYRGEKSRSSTPGMPQGYGLGLSLAKNIVDLHKGTIAVESKPGSTKFTVVLPQIQR